MFETGKHLKDNVSYEKFIKDGHVFFTARECLEMRGKRVNDSAQWALNQSRVIIDNDNEDNVMMVMIAKQNDY